MSQDHSRVRPEAAFALRVRGVSLDVDGCRLLDAIDWDVRAGSVGAVLGPNGSGKSSLLRVVTGYWFPTLGTVDVFGARLGTIHVDDLRRQIGFVCPSGTVQPDERLEVVEVVLSGFFGHLCIDFDDPTAEQFERANDAIKLVGLAGHERQKYRTLSAGEQRRALLARGLAPNPKMLLLDEPTAGLDLVGRETLLATLNMVARRHPDVTIVMVTHHLDELLPQTESILLLARGRAAAQGRPENVLVPKQLEAVYGLPVDVHQNAGRWSWSVQPKAWERLVP